MNGLPIYVRNSLYVSIIIQGVIRHIDPLFILAASAVYVCFHDTVQHIGLCFVAYLELGEVYITGVVGGGESSGHPAVRPRSR